jgi:hypothetical protein
MRRKLGPLAALAMLALIGAGCSNGSAENGNTGTGSSTGTGSRCARMNGEFPRFAAVGHVE